MGGNELIPRVYIRNYDNLLSLHRLLADGEPMLVGYIEGRIDIPERSGLFSVESPTHLVLVGIGPGAGFRWPAESFMNAQKVANGFYFYNRATLLLNLRISGFSGTGGCIKGNRTCESLSISACCFGDIGNVAYPRIDPELDPAHETSENIVHSQAVSGSAKSLMIESCDFDDIGFGSHYSHTIYPAECESLEIRRSTFVRCPNPLSLNHTKHAEISADFYTDCARTVRHRSDALVNEYIVYGHQALTGRIRGQLRGSVGGRVLNADQFADELEEID